MPLIGYVMMLASMAMLNGMGFDNIIMFLALGVVAVFNKFFPKMFILWVAIAMVIPFLFSEGTFEVQIVLAAGLFSAGLVLAAR
jgi:hypothetical protein